MRVIFICADDYANFGFIKSEALKSIGVNSEAFILNKHPFNYDKEATVVSIAEMKEQINNADIINIVHSDITAMRLCDGIDKRIFVWHTGTRFRQSSFQLNTLFNNVEKVFYALGEFEYLCKGDYFSVTVDTDSLPFTPTNNERLLFSHHPSNANVKGTEAINRVMNSIENKTFNVNIDSSILPFAENLNRIKACDVYIEMCSIQQGGRPYGSFGTTAVEAASLGKIVITNSLWDENYTNWYGKHELVIANTENELREKILWLASLPKERIDEMKQASRDWAVRCHGYEATGKRLLDYYL